MQELQQALETQNFQKACQLYLELEVRQQLSINDYAPYLITLIITQQLPEAKFLMKRVPKELKSDQNFLFVREVFKNLWIKDYKACYQNIQKCIKANIPQSHHLLDYVRNKVLNLIEKSFKTINKQEALQFLGLENNDLVELVQKRGWNIEGSWFVPKQQAQQPVDVNVEEKLQKLNDLMNFIEMQGLK